MQPGYWFVQESRLGGSVGEEQRCNDAAEAAGKVRDFKASNTDPDLRMRVHVPSYATDDERRQISELSVGIKLPKNEPPAMTRFLRDLPERSERE